MKLFGTKAAQSSPRPVLARAWGSGAVALGEWPASYEAQLRAGVVTNPVAQRAVRLVSEGAGGAALVASGSDAAARALALVQARSGGQGLVETLACHLLLHGNAYVQILAGADGAPVELFALRPERVSVEGDARGWPAAYLYRVGEDMPDIAANSLSIAFGNFQAGYVIAERSETSILRDPFSNKPFVHFYAVKRIGGAVANAEAIKLMKFAVS